MPRKPRVSVPGRAKFWIYRVQLTSLVVPKWALDIQPAEFERDDRCIVWLKSRQLASLLSKMDREDGGHPILQRVAYHKCKVCGRVLLGASALARLKYEGASPHKQLEPCGPDCIADKEQLKSNRSLNAK